MAFFAKTFRLTEAHMAFKPVVKKTERNPNRLLILDGDIIAYDCAYGVVAEQVENMYIRLDLKIKSCMDIAECGGLEVHLTGKENFRNDVAMLQQYKGNRYHPDGSRKIPRPEFLPDARKYLVRKYAAIISNNEEADDTMSYRAWHINAGRDEIYTEAVLGTSDKDIGINPGLFMNIMYDTIQLQCGFGEIELAKNKIKGWGLKFFCAQLLMGDPTDNIKGLPKVPMLAKETWGTRRGGFGPVATFNIINKAKSYKGALALVMLMYKEYVDEFIPDGKIKTWRGDTIDYTWKDLLTEQGRLLWMRRIDGEMWDYTVDYSNEEQLMWAERKANGLKMPTCPL